MCVIWVANGKRRVNANSMYLTKRPHFYFSLPDECKIATIGTMNQKGMSLTELVVVIGIILVLSLAAIPIFHGLKGLANKKSFFQTVAMLESSLAEIKVKQMVLDQEKTYPTTLDTNPNNFACNRCFELVFEKGVSSSLWFKKNDHTYLFSTNGNEGANEGPYTEQGDFQLVYQPATGQFIHTRF